MVSCAIQLGGDFRKGYVCEVCISLISFYSKEAVALALD